MPCIMPMANNNNNNNNTRTHSVQLLTSLHISVPHPLSLSPCSTVTDLPSHLSSLFLPVSRLIAVLLLQMFSPTV